MDFIQLHVIGKPVPLNQRVPGRTFPLLLEQIMDRALAKRPEARFSSAAELATALQAVMHGATELPPQLGGKSGETTARLASRAQQDGHALANQSPASGPLPSPALASLPLVTRRPARTSVPLLLGVAAAFLLLGIGLALVLMKALR
jgi:hypothetical protein